MTINNEIKNTKQNTKNILHNILVHQSYVQQFQEIVTSIYLY